MPLTPETYRTLWLDLATILERELLIAGEVALQQDTIEGLFEVRGVHRQTQSILNDMTSLEAAAGVDPRGRVTRQQDPEATDP